MIALLALLGAVGWTAALLLRAAVLVVKRSPGAGRAAGRAALVTGVYMAVLLAVSLLSRERVLGLNEFQCFDHWCVAVTRAQLEGTRGMVSLRIRNTAGRVSLRPDHPRVRVVESSGRSVAPSTQDGPPLDKRLAPGESFAKDLVFELSPGERRPVVVVTEGGWPTRLVIGDDNSLLHKKPFTPVTGRPGS